MADSGALRMSDDFLHIASEDGQEFLPLGVWTELSIAEEMLHLYVGEHESHLRSVFGALHPIAEAQHRSEYRIKLIRHGLAAVLIRFQLEVLGR